MISSWPPGSAVARQFFLFFFNGVNSKMRECKKKKKLNVARVTLWGFFVFVFFREFL